MKGSGVRVPASALRKPGRATERWPSTRQRVCRARRSPSPARAIVGWGAAGGLKRKARGSDQNFMSVTERLPVKAGPVPDKLTIWPVDDGRYGLDATFQGASGYKRVEHHQQELQRRGVPHTFRQELGGGWTLRFEIGRASCRERV